VKTTSAPWRALLDLAGRIAGFLFGHISWSAPPWLRGTGRCLAELGKHMSTHRRGWSGGIVALTLLVGGWWLAWQWWESHRPRLTAYEEVQKVQVTWEAPARAALGVEDKALAPTPFTVRFSLPAAPLEMTGKAPGPGVTMTPEVPGTWRWSDNRTLVFTPAALHWAPASSHTVTLDPSELAPNLAFDRGTLEFTTPPLFAELRDFHFYTSPKDPGVHQVVGELRTSHPAELGEVIRQLDLEVLGGATLFTPGSPRFTVDPGNGPRQFFIRSRNLTIPAREDFVKLRVREGLASSAGGLPLAAGVEAKTRVPDKFSGFKLTGANTRIIRDEEGEPQQILFIESDLDLDSAEVARLLSVDWRAGSFNPNDRKKLEAQLGESESVPLVPLDAEAPLSRQHAFRFTEPRHGGLLVRVRPGVKAPGGFELGQPFEAVAAVPRFPKEVDLLGKGNVLTLGGARRLLARSRGIDHLQVTFGRVPLSQVQHLVTQNRDGSFSAPNFRSYGFNESYLVQRWHKVIPVPRQNDWEALQSEIDLAEAPPLHRPDPLAGGRGIFFVDVRPVQPLKPLPPDATVYSRIEGPRDFERGGWREDDRDGKGFAEGWTEAEGQTDARFVMVTDLGLVVKSAVDGSRDVFVMSLGAGLPVEGVQLQALARNGTVLAESLTDSAGHAKLPDLAGFTHERQPVAVLASLADDVTFLPLREGQLPAMDYSRFEVDGVLASRQKAVEAFLFTERGVYRPGDPVQVGALVHRRDWQPVIEGLPVRLSITDPQGRSVATETRRLPYDGFFEAKLPLPEAGSLGNYEISAHVLDGQDRPLFRLGRTVVRVEEFQPDRMKVETRVDPAPPAGWLPPAAAVAKVEVRSLFGDAAPERRVTMKLELSPTDFTFPAWPGFTFHDRAIDRAASRAGRAIDLGEMKTDAAGKAEFKLPLETLQDASYRLSITTEAFEREGGRSVRHAFSQLVSPWDRVLGWKADGDLDYLGKDATGTVRLIAIDKTLAAVPMADLRRRLVEIRQVAALTKLKNGNYAYVSTRRERVVSEDALTLDAGGSEFALSTALAGTFRLEILDAAETTLCSIPYRVAGKGDPGRSLDRETELEMVLGKGEVLAGEEVEIHLTAPYAGAGLVTLERDRVLSHHWFRTETQQTTVRVRVPAGTEGTVYVNAAFVRSPSSPEVFHSPLSYAAAPLRITPVHRQLEVKLDGPEVVRPGSEARFGFSASQTSRLVLYAVDEGIHRITRYELPRPLDFFTRKQALEVRTLQWLDLLLPEYQFLKAAPAFGGDGDGEGPLSLHLNPFKRRQEAPVVFWSGIVEAGPERREVAWQVPDYFNGNLRVMAVAAHAGGMGVAEAATLVKAPVILVPNTPLFVSPGDEFEASVAVTHNLDPKVPAAIKVVASSSSHLEAAGPSEVAVQLDPGAEGIVRFRFKSTEELGGAELKFVASAAGETIARGTTLSVRPATHHLTKVQSGWFRTGSYEVKTRRSLYPRFRRAEATGSVLPLGLARGLEAYVSGFPHGCSEQITSRAMVKLLVSTEADFGLSPALAAEQVRGAIAQLARRQQADGGFGYWHAGAPRMFEFQSLYVLHFLTEAKGLGHPVPQSMMTAALRHAAETARANIRDLDQAELQAYAIYLLARNGSAAAPQLLNLRDTLAKHHSGKWEGGATAAWLAGSYRLLKQDKEAEALMKACVGAGHPAAGSSYHRTAEAEALKIFYVRCRHFPADARRFGHEDLEPVMAPLRDESFTTLTASFMTLALKAYGDVAATTGLQLSLLALPETGKEMLLDGPKPGLVRGEFPAGTRAVGFRRDQVGAGDIGIFFQTVEQGYDRAASPDAFTSGLGVFREIRPVKAGQPLRAGDAVEVTLSVRNLADRRLDHLAVIDLLPAGFEVVAGDLQSGPGTVPGTGYAELREDRTLFYLGLAPNGEWSVRYRMKAVSPGSFIVPPAMAEDMYDRGRHGVSKAEWIEVISER
jgi:uncharacterized protein YfaS (alpha-2-macroglobulin family)